MEAFQHWMHHSIDKRNLHTNFTSVFVSHKGQANVCQLTLCLIWISIGCLWVVRLFIRKPLPQPLQESKDVENGIVKKSEDEIVHQRNLNHNSQNDPLLMEPVENGKAVEVPEEKPTTTDEKIETKSQFSKVKPPPTFDCFLKYCILFGGFMMFFYLCDSQHVFPDGERMYSRDLFVFLCFLLFAVACYFTIKVNEDKILNRNQTMNTDENKNFSKFAFIFLNIVTEHLRNIFRQKWDTQHPSNPWQNDKSSLLYLKTEAQKHGIWNKLTAPKAGDPDDWDPTNLFYVLLYSKTITLPAAHHRQIDTLRQIRNTYFAHPSTASISNTAFKAINLDIKTCMIGLNCSNSVQKQMEDVKNEIMKVPEDYMKEVKGKLYVIKTLETDNNKLLMHLLYLLFLLLLLVVVIVAKIFNFPMSFLHPSRDHIDLPTITTCSNSRNFFPEVFQPSYYIGHDWEINTGASVLANGSYPMVSITGPPAIGKTATAVAVGHILKNNHSYQVAFVDFKEINVGSSHIRTDIYKAIVLSIDYNLKNVSDSSLEFKMLMMKITTRPTLLIFDNIENILLNYTSKAILLDEVMPLCLAINKIKILTTSRKDHEIIRVPIYSIKLEPLSVSQSTDLLFELSKGSLQRSSVKKIAEKTGGIPLLLEVTASLVRSKICREDKLLERFEELPVLVVLNDTKVMTKSNNYYKLLKIVYDGLDPSLQATFISLGAVPFFMNHTSADAIVNFNFSETVDLYPLVNYNLLKTFELPSKQILYRMHPVIGEFARLVSEENSKLHHLSFGSCYVVTAKSPINYAPVTLVAYSDMTLQQPIGEDYGNIPPFLVHNGLNKSEEQFLGISTFEIGLHYYVHGDYTESIDALLSTVKLFKDNNEVLKILVNFAGHETEKFLKQGNVNLSTKFSNFLLYTLDLIETDPCFVAISLCKLGTLLNDTLLYKDALIFLNHALTNYQQQYQQENCSKDNLGSLALFISANLLKSHDDQLEADWRLAKSYYTIQDNETCFQIVRRVLKSSYEVDYHKQKHVFQYLTDLAIKAADTYFNQSNVALTTEFSILSLNTLKMLETDSCFVSSLYYHIGILFYDLGKYRDTAFAFNQTWTFLKQKKCGVENLGLVAYALGTACHHCGQYNDSIDVLRIAVDLLEKDGVRQFMANSWLASSYCKIQEHETCYQITRNILSNNSYFCPLNSSLLCKEVLKNLTNFAGLAAIEYRDKGNYNQSIEFYHLYFANLEMVDAHSCLIASMYSDLGCVLFDVQRYADTVVALNKALELYQRNGCDEEGVGVAALGIGILFFNIGQYNNTIKVLPKANLLKSHDDQLQAGWLLATSYYKTQNYETCFQIVRKVLNSSYEVDYHKQKHVFQALTDFALKAAHTYLNQSNFAMTIQFSILSLNTLKMLETDSCFVASLYFEVGHVFSRLRTLYRDAAFAFSQSWAFHKQNKCGEENLGLVAFALGTTYYYCGQYNDSIDVLRIAVDLLEKDDQFEANYMLIISYFRLHDYENCFQILRKVFDSSDLDRVDHLKYRQELESLRMLARIYKIL